MFTKKHTIRVIALATLVTLLLVTAEAAVAQPSAPLDCEECVNMMAQVLAWDGTRFCYLMMFLEKKEPAPPPSPLWSSENEVRVGGYLMCGEPGFDPFMQYLKGSALSLTDDTFSFTASITTMSGDVCDVSLQGTGGFMSRYEVKHFDVTPDGSVEVFSSEVETQLWTGFSGTL